MSRQFRIFAVLALASVLPTAQAQMLRSSHAPTSVASNTSSTVAPAASNGKPVALVNGVGIPRDAYEAEVTRLFPYATMHGGAVPKEYEGEIRERALQNLIDTELAYQEAKRRLKITPAEKQERIAQIKKDYKSNAEFNASIQQYFGSRAAFEAKLQHDMLLDKLFRLEVKSKSTVTDAEVLSFYQKNSQAYVVPESATFQSISTLFPKNPTVADKEAARKRIEALMPEIKAASVSFEKFGILAESKSEDEFRVMMGEHKMVHLVGLSPEFERVKNMKPGQLTGIIESADGFHIIRMGKRNPARKLAFAEVKPDLKKSLQKERLTTNNKTFHERLRKAAKIEIVKG